MKKTTSMIIALVACTLVTSAIAKEKFYPEQDPVLKYDLPKGWLSETFDTKGMPTTVASQSDRVSATFSGVPEEANMDLYNKKLAELKKQEGWEAAKVIDKPTLETGDGLEAYVGVYEAKGENGRTYRFTPMLIKGGKGQSIFCYISVSDPDTLKKEDKEAFDKFVKSLKAEGSK